MSLMLGAMHMALHKAHTSFTSSSPVVPKPWCAWTMHLLKQGGGTPQPIHLPGNAHKLGLCLLISHVLPHFPPYTELRSLSKKTLAFSRVIARWGSGVQASWECPGRDAFLVSSCIGGRSPSSSSPRTRPTWPPS